MKRTVSIILCMSLIFALTITASALPDSETVEKTIIALGIMTGDDKGNMNLTKSVTRAEFAKLMIAASVYKDTIETGSGFSPFRDVKSTHWASGYIKAVVDAKWMTGYTDGTFRPENTITFEEAASAILKMLDYGASDLSGTYPGAQISKFKALKLDAGVSPVQGRALTRNECMYFFYNLMGASAKSGAVYGVTLGIAMNSAGEPDYDELIKAEIKGPYILKDLSLASILPFDIRQAAVSRNNTPASGGDAAMYDVVYYNEKTKAVWVYSDRAIGTLTAVSPNAVTPASVTVGGNSYNLETSAAKAKVSATGGFAVGDTVALLLGMNGEVADVISASEVDGTYYGVVTGVELTTYAVDASKSTVNYTLTAACTDGVTRQCIVRSKDYTVGSLVKISYAKGELTVGGAGAGSLSGKFSSDGKKLGDYPLAGDVQIMDVTKDGGWKLIYPQRLAGATLDSGKVRFYILNDRQEISILILNDVTGDMYSYGVLTGVQETVTPATGGGMPGLSGVYNYVIDGKAGVLNSTTVLYNVRNGAAIFYYKDGKINDIKNLTSVAISGLSALTATGGNKRFTLADGLQTYLRSGSEYTLTNISALNTDEYKLTGYYEDIYPAGGHIRIIVAEQR